VSGRGTLLVQPTVAIVNTNDDLVSALQHALEEEGLNIVTAHIEAIKSGAVDFAAFLDRHDPAVVIYDIALPYDQNWIFLKMLRQLPHARRRSFVVTTVNIRALEARVGSTDAIEIQGGHADDLEPTLDAVRASLRGQGSARSRTRSSVTGTQPASGSVRVRKAARSRRSKTRRR
jgi:CheY-like chemotaxis protein